MHCYWFNSPLMQQGVRNKVCSEPFLFEVVGKCDGVTGKKRMVPVCLWEHILRDRVVLERRNTCQLVADPWPFHIYCVESHRLFMTATTRERGKWSILPFPSYAQFKVRFLSLLCVLADRLFQWYTLSVWNIS